MGKKRRFSIGISTQMESLSQSLRRDDSCGLFRNGNLSPEGVK